MHVDKLARLTLATCGAGPILHAGCGKGSLVRLLLRMGCPAHGFDPDASIVAQANACTPGHFHAGFWRRLPFTDHQFDSVLCERALETLEDDAVDEALKEMARVVRRSVLAIIRLEAPGADFKGIRRDRAWWESRFFTAGFRKHPAYYRVSPYEAIDLPTPEILIALEASPQTVAAARASDPARALDMRKVSGPQSDARLAAYHLACEMVRSGDVVLDASCGAGDGAHLVASLTQASRVIATDSNPNAIGYAQREYGTSPRIEFRVDGESPLRAQRDHSVDVVLNLTSDQRADVSDAFLAEVARVLRPGGRLVTARSASPGAVSPDEPSSDELATWRDQIGKRLLIQRVYRQVIGDPARGHGARVLREIKPADMARVAADCWILVASVDVTTAANVPYEEIYYGYSKPPAELLAFERDYDNPWLVRSLVEYPTRYLNAEVLASTALRVADVSRSGSADEGAGLCVLGYRLLENDEARADEVNAMVSRLAAYVRRQPENAHQLRWRISLSFLQGQLLLKLGRFDDAETAFAQCRRFDCSSFSPTLGTKTVLGCFLAGWVARGRGQLEAARTHWKDGLAEAKRLLQCDWSEFLGRPDNPLPFPLITAVEFLDTANLCANALRWTAPDGRASDYGDWSCIHQGWRLTLEERYRAMQEMETMIRDRDATIVEASHLLEERGRLLELLQKANRAQAKLIDERWESMQQMEKMIAERDGALRDQRRVLEECREALANTEHMVRSRDETISAQASLIEERWAAMQQMEQMIRDRDEAIAAQARLIEERWTAMQEMEQMIRDRDVKLEAQAQTLESRTLALQKLENLKKRLRGSK